MRASSRAKDLVDLTLITQLFTLDAAELRRTVRTVFAKRATHQPPRVVPTPPDQWRVPFGHLAQAVGLDDDLGAGHRTVAVMLDPILDHQVRAGTWNPGAQRWTVIVTP